MNWLFSIVIFLSFFTAATGFSESDHSDTPKARIEATKRESTASLKDYLKKQSRDEAWWLTAEALLDRLSQEESSQFAKELNEGPRRTSFEALVKARFEVTAKELLQRSKQGSGNPDENEAAKQEVRRRMEEDPNVKLLSELFEVRAETAMLREDAIQKALKKEDDREAARIIAGLLGTRYKAQKEEILKRLKKEIEKEEVKENPNRFKFVQRLLWSTEDYLGEKAGTSSVESAFKGIAKEANEKAKKDVAQFNENLRKAAEGDEAAKRALLKDYPPENLIDFMASQKSVEMAKALGWKDKDGNWNLNLRASDPGFRKEASNETQTWVLGKTPEEIQKSIAAFGKTHGPDSESTSPSRNRFDRFTLNTDPPGKDGRHLFSINDEGRPSPVVPTSDKGKVCQSETIEPDKKVPLEHTAWYFFRQFPESNWVGYAADINGDSKNRMINLDEPGKELEVPGPYDPVPTPDEKYVTVPEAFDGDGIKFYKTGDIKKLGKDAKPFFTDKSLGGVYQSIGTVSQDDKSTTYRIITDQKSLSFRDYKVTHAGPDGEPKVEALEAKPIELCKNTGIELVTPMLSKDGKQVSFLDVEEGVTKIFDIVDPKTGDCELSLNLGLYTGKVDFNYNGDELVFHKYENERPRERYITVPDNELVANVYMYSRSKKQLTRLTNNTNSNSVYPSFRKQDGKVMMLDHVYDENKKEHSSLTIVDPAKGRPVKSDFIIEPPSKQNDERDRKWHAATALGALWSQICSPAGKDISSEGAVLSTLNLFPERCRDLVNQFWLSFRNQVVENRELSKSTRILPGELARLERKDLIKACPNEGGAPPDEVGGGDNGGGGGGGGGNNPLPGIPQLCYGCHSNAGNFIPFDDPDRLRSELASRTLGPDGKPMTMADAILDRIASTNVEYRMPRNGPLTTAQRKAIIEYLKP